MPHQGFNPLADFVGGQSSALGLQSQRQGIQREAAAAPVRNQLSQINLQRAETGLEREDQQFDQGQALRRIKLLNQGARAIGTTDPAQWEQAIPQVVKFLGDQGVDAQELSQGITPENLASFISQTDELLRDPAKIRQLSVDESKRQSLLEDIQPALDESGVFDPNKADSRALSAARELNLVAKPGTKTGQERIAGNKKLAEDIADTQGVISEAKEFSKLTGSSRAKAIDSGFDKIVAINKNIENIDRAIEQIDLGADTGAIESRFFPSIKASTVALEQIQSELALDVVGATTFGALSQGELDLAKQVALPTRLDSAELKQFLIDKKAAQAKLMAYFQEQIDFIDQGGTKAGFLRSKGRSQPQAERQGGQIMIDEQGNRARVFPDGTFEEL